VRGFAALREYAEAHTRVLRGRHMTLNHLYDVDGDRATGCATTVVSIATPSGYKIMGQGAYHDDLVKFGGKWRIVVSGNVGQSCRPRRCRTSPAAY
jgi:hypothetical protein